MGIGLQTGVLALASVACVSAQSGGELRFCLGADPKTFDPLLAEEEPSDVVRGSPKLLRRYGSPG